MVVRVRYRDAEPSGLAAMLGGLIEANLAAHPERRRLLRPAVVAVTATDLGLSVSFRLLPGEVVVANGIVGRPRIEVRADAATLAELSSVPLRLGLPDPLTEEGRAAAAKLRTGAVRVRGMLRHPLTLSRFNRLLSVR